MNLIESWQALQVGTVSQAVRDMNEALGARYSPQEFYKWRRGDKSIPQPVVDFLIRETIAFAVLQSLGIEGRIYANEQLDALVEMLSVPARRP